MLHRNILLVSGQGGPWNRRVRKPTRRFQPKGENVEDGPIIRRDGAAGLLTDNMPSCARPTKRRRRPVARRKRRGVSHTASPNVLRTEVTLDWSNDRRVVAIWNRTRSSAVYASISRRRRRVSVRTGSPGYDRHIAIADAQSTSVEDLCEHLRRLSLRPLDTNTAVPPSDDVDATFEAQVIDELCQLMSRLTLADESQSACRPGLQAVVVNDYDKEAALLRMIAVRSSGISPIDKELNRLGSIAPDVFEPQPPAITQADSCGNTASSLQRLQATCFLSSEGGVAAVPYIRSFLPLLRLNRVVTSIWAPVMRRL